MGIETLYHKLHLENLRQKMDDEPEEIETGRPSVNGTLIELYVNWVRGKIRLETSSLHLISIALDEAQFEIARFIAERNKKYEQQKKYKRPRKESKKTNNDA